MKDTIWTCDKSASAVSADATNHSPYDNQAPPIPPRRQKTAESDAYMIPCELPSESVDINNLSPSIKHIGNNAIVHERRNCLAIAMIPVGENRCAITRH